MTSQACLRSPAAGTSWTVRGTLFRAVCRAADEGVSRRAFAMRAGLTTAEVSMLERATGVSLAA